MNVEQCEATVSPQTRAVRGSGNPMGMGVAFGLLMGMGSEITSWEWELSRVRFNVPSDALLVMSGTGFTDQMSQPTAKH